MAAQLNGEMGLLDRIRAQYTTTKDIDMQLRILEIQQREAQAACLAAQKQAETLSWQMAVLQDHRGTLGQEENNGDDTQQSQ